MIGRCRQTAPKGYWRVRIPRHQEFASAPWPRVCATRGLPPHLSQRFAATAGAPDLPIVDSQASPMPDRILVPLIVACALFMENLDSTVIATALPAIASDFGGQPNPPEAGTHLLPAGARDLHSGVGLARRPVRRAAHLPPGDRHLHRRLDPLRAVEFHSRDRVRPYRAGDRRVDDGAGRAAGDPEDGDRKRSWSARWPG